MINSFSKTDDFIKNDKFSYKKLMILSKMINLFSKTDDFMKSEKIKVFPLVCSKYLSSWTGKSRSGHDWSQSFGPIWHVSGPEMVFWRNNLMILHHFCWRSSKIKLFWPKTLIFDQKFPKILKKYVKICFWFKFWFLISCMF